MKIYNYYSIISSVIFFVMVSYTFAEGIDVDRGDELNEERASMGVTSSGNVTLDFKDADITNVLRILSYKSGINIIAGKDVSGPVTIRLTDVPWDKALEVILRTYGYTDPAVSTCTT